MVNSDLQMMLLAWFYKKILQHVNIFHTDNSFCFWTSILNPSILDLLVDKLRLLSVSPAITVFSISSLKGSSMLVWVTTSQTLSFLSTGTLHMSTLLHSRNTLNVIAQHAHCISSSYCTYRLYQICNYPPLPSSSFGHFSPLAVFRYYIMLLLYYFICIVFLYILFIFI